MTVDEGDGRAIDFNFHAKLLKCGPHRSDLTTQALEFLLLRLILLLVGVDDTLLQFAKLLHVGTPEDKEAADNDTERNGDAWERQQQVFRYHGSFPQRASRLFSLSQPLPVQHP